MDPAAQRGLVGIACGAGQKIFLDIDTRARTTGEGGSWSTINL